MEKPKVIPGVHILFRRYNRPDNVHEYLLHKRLTGYMKDYFSAPGGHVEGYESSQEAAICESMEELGKKLMKGDLSLAYVIHRVNKDNNEIRIDYCLLTERFDNDFKNMEPEKHSDPKWYQYGKFPKPMVPSLEKAIDAIERKDFNRVLYFVES